MNIRKKGSATIEATIILPVIIFFFFLFITLLRIYTLYNCVSNAMYKTGDTAIEYGALYYEKGIEKISDKVKEKIGETFGVNFIVDAGKELLYKEVFKVYFLSQIEKEEIYNLWFKDKVTYNFTGTGFYFNNGELYLTVKCTYDTWLPFYSDIFGDFAFRKNLSVKIFASGDSYTIKNENEKSVWSKSNFERGRIIESKFGKNLPEFFPVIDIFNKGKVTSIVSINHRAKSYHNPDNLYKQLAFYVNELYDFKGANCQNVEITEENIREKELKIVFPEDEFKEGQEKVVNEIKKAAGRLNIRVIVERYEYV